MVNWKYKCDINSHIENANLSIRERLIRVSEELTKSPAFNNTTFPAELLEISELEEPELTKEGNYIIQRIYDFADKNLIWMGP